MSKVSRVKVVYANWCPHCVPTTVEPMKEVAREIGAELELLDIDVAGELADEVVQEHGDWCADYIIPQVFFEYTDGTVKHVMSGYSESVDMTKRAIANLRKSAFYRKASS